VIAFPVATPPVIYANVSQWRQIAGSPDATSGQAPSAAAPKINRSQSRELNVLGIGPLKTLAAPKVASSTVVRANPNLGLSINGISGLDQRLANNGNQFDDEPPDQALCAGNGFVLEVINNALRVYGTTGNPLTGVIDLNTFYGDPAENDRTTGLSGTFHSDPMCYYDADTQRWFQTIFAAQVDPVSGNLLGPNEISIAVSTSTDPTGSWVIYHLPTQDDGTQGTPNHGCSLGPCYGDYPHIGADKYGFYVTTNEYSLFGPEFKSAQIYAFSKNALAANATTVSVVQIDTTGAVSSRMGSQPGFTVIPAIAGAGNYLTRAGGVEFFMSSNAAQEATGVPGGTYSNEIIVWAMTNTQSLSSGGSIVALTNTVLKSEVYGLPPFADQKVGPVPQADCLNIDCFGFGLPPTPQVEGMVDASDSRMMQVWQLGSTLWSSLDTATVVGGQNKAGIAYFSVSSKVDNRGNLSSEIVQQGYLAIASNNVIYPAIAMLPNGKGVMAFTLVGQDFFPSAGYATLNADGAGNVHVAAAGSGPQDGFTEYYGGGPMPRWGDYGAAVTDGNSVWFASEYIDQTCTFAAFLVDMTCGGTRDKYVNWGTRISKLNP
jgi:hypothetical protein